MRGKRAKQRQVERDLIYDSALVTRLVNRLMSKGRKSIALEIVYGALAKIDTEKPKSLAVLEEALRNISPQEEVRSRRIGGATYQIPFPLDHARSLTLGIRWLVQAARQRKGVPMVEKLAQEVQAAAKGEGSAVAKHAEVHRMAEANRAFAHFRW